MSRRLSTLTLAALLAPVLQGCATLSGTNVFRQRLSDDVNLSLADHGNYYNYPNLARFTVGVAAAAPIANTSADADIRRWYQERAHGETVDGLARAVNYAGQAWVIVPALVELAALAGKADENYMFDGGFREWGNRSLRAVAVGFPPVVAMYGILGSSRPDRGNHEWQPFRDFHGASGHTFMGAVPFLTAAAMADDPLCKAPLFLGSFLAGWSRIHEDRHYFSQVALGWWFAYLAVRSVDLTQQEHCFRLVPTFGPEGQGIAVHIEY